MKTKKNNTATTVIWIVLVLAGATGLGYGIRQVRWSLAMRRNVSESESQTRVARSEPENEAAPKPEPQPKPEVKVVQEEPAVVEEPVWEEPEEEPQPEVAAEPQRQPWQPGQNWGAVRQFFAGLNLNEEEQARLQEGLALMRRQFESMSYEDQQAEMMRMAEIGWRWSNMSDQEREAVTQRMRDRYEQWRRSDSIELPQLTLD